MGRVQCTHRAAMANDNTLFAALGAHLRFVKILLAYFSFSWKKELHVVAGDLSGTNDIAGSTSVLLRK